MAYPILGLHHVTATVDEARPDLDFCLGALGLRLVKKTVNFDNHHVYHFYYGDERGTPGTIWTTFPYHGRGVRVGVKGAGQVTTTVFSIPRGAALGWEEHLLRRNVAAEPIESAFGERGVACADSSGLRFQLLESDDRRQPWTRSVDRALAIRGLHSVVLTVRDPGPTIALMEEFLGWTVAARNGASTRLAVAGGGPGKTIDVVRAPEAEAAVNGLGTVHHVAMAIERAEDQARLRESLLAAGLKVTEIRDRCYFQSIYFREPQGVLFEVATTHPGFTVDESLADLGTGLKLPPWEESNRGDIEAHIEQLPAMIR